MRSSSRALNIIERISDLYKELDSVKSDRDYLRRLYEDVKVKHDTWVSVILTANRLGLRIHDEDPEVSITRALQYAADHRGCIDTHDDSRKLRSRMASIPPKEKKK